MATRNYGLYQSPEGELLINFEPGIEGVPVESLIPPAHRGERFDDFPLENYFALASTVLVSPADWQQFQAQQPSRGLATAATPEPEFPKPDLDYLGLRDPNGSMNAARTAELFKIVAAYYEARAKTLALSPGVVAQCWHNGLNADLILSTIRRFTRPDGQLDFHAVEQENRDPVLQTYLALQKPDTAFLKPDQLELLLDWLTVLPRHDPNFKDPEQRQFHLQFMGLLDLSGQPNPKAISIARDYIWSHEGQPPHYAELWREVQTALGRFAKRTPNPKTDAQHYQDWLVPKLDAGLSNTELATQILQAAKTGAVPIATAPLQAAAAIEWKLTHAGLRALAEAETINQQPMEWLPFDAGVGLLRQLLKSKHYGLDPTEIQALLDDQARPGLMRQLRHLFGDAQKRQILRQVGILDAQGQWSEAGFLRQQKLAQQLQAQGRTPHLPLLRLKLHEAHHADQDIPVAWALLADDLNPPQLMLAKRLLNMALSGGMLGQKVRVGDHLSPDLYQTMRRIGAWLYPRPVYDQIDGLRWAANLVRRGSLNWKQWAQICSFIYPKLDQDPDPTRLEDWLEGLVNFEGEGLHRQTPPKPFAGTKIGRNEPCPCGSGRKYKKCCGV